MQKPVFTDRELKWTPKNSASYRGSLSPAVGESQFEYRERLKWEFAENNKFIKIIRKVNERRQMEEERKIREKERTRKLLEDRRIQMEYIRQYGGGYCGFDCRYFYEEYFDVHGAIIGDLDNEGYVEYNCRLGHTVSEGAFCVDYESKNPRVILD